MENSLGMPMKAKRKKMTLNIFNLNEYCLVEILRYLRLEDVHRAIEADKRFRSPACIRFAYGGLYLNLIDPSFFRKYPRELRDDFIEAFGKRTTTITFKLLHESNFFNLIPHFRNLQELILRQIDITSSSPFPDGLRLQKLELDKCRIDQMAIRPWFKHLNPTLTHLKLIEEHCSTCPCPILAIDELTNIKSLYIDGHSAHTEKCYPIIKKFVDLNKNHMLSLSLLNFNQSNRVERYSQIPFSPDIGQLRKLKKLHLHYAVLMETGSNVFPELASLMLSNVSREDYDIIENLACEESLDTLIISDYYGYDERNLPLSHLLRFKNLRELCLTEREWSDSDFRLMASHFKQLHTLGLDRGEFGCADDVLEIPKLIPRLRELSLEWIHITDEWMYTHNLETNLITSYPELGLVFSIQY